MDNKTTSTGETKMKTKTFDITDFIYLPTDPRLTTCHMRVEATIRDRDRGSISCPDVGFIERDKYSGGYFATVQLFNYIKTDEANRYLGVYNTLAEAKASLEQMVENLVIWENAERRDRKMAHRVY
jgi:hypothetical protein